MTTRDSQPITEALKRAIRAYPASLCELARRSGVAVPILSRFMGGKRGMTSTTLDRLATFLKLELRPVGQAESRTGRKGE